MKNKMRYLKIFEEFSKEEREDLINKKLTYLDYFSDFKKSPLSNVQNKIKELDFSNFRIEKYANDITIYPDNEFKKLIEELNIDQKINLDSNMIFDISIDFNNLNSINIWFELNDILKGLNIGYKIYQKIIDNFDYVTSYSSTLPLAKNIWYKLMINPKYFFFTSKIISGVINKETKKLKEILIDLKNNIYEKSFGKITFEELIFDKYLQEKIKLWNI